MFRKPTAYELVQAGCMVAGISEASFYEVRSTVQKPQRTLAQLCIVGYLRHCVGRLSQYEMSAIIRRSRFSMLDLADRFDRMSAIEQLRLLSAIHEQISQNARNPVPTIREPGVSLSPWHRLEIESGQDLPGVRG